MSDKLELYKQAVVDPDDTNMVWPLYGTGLENLGVDKKPIQVPMPEYGPDELLVRHDATGLCFSDIKVINLGEDHPRIYRNMKEDPVVLGHEISLVVAGVGEKLKDQYKVGDRFVVQADIWVNGVGYAYGYEIQGGLSKYAVLDQRILNGDDGNYLIPVQETTGYSESALTEPWACVIAAYQLKYRTGIKAGGVTWVVGTDRARENYTISSGFDAESHPAKVLLSNVPAAFAEWLKKQAAELGVEVVEVEDITAPPADEVDDILMLGADADVIETVSPKLAVHGVVAIVDDERMPRKTNVDMGRVHYNRWVYVGTTESDIAMAYSKTPVRATLRQGGRAMFVGAGGPMGRMHVQRAIQKANGPTVVVATDVSDVRLNDLKESFADEAKAKGVDFVCLNPMNKEEYEAGIAPFRKSGFDDVVVLAPIPPVIADAATFLVPNGVMNVFAGVARGTTVALDLSEIYLNGHRHIGHSASSIDDMRLMLHETESGELSTNRAVAAVGSLNAAWDGLKAVKESTFPGKVVIYPHIKDLPVTPLPELKEKLPTVYAKLKDGREWTTEAEAEFLRIMLP